VNEERKEGKRRTLGDGQRRRPLFPKNVEADRAVGVDTEESLPGQYSSTGEDRRGWTHLGW
jgi:hypothetical protein